MTRTITCAAAVLAVCLVAAADEDLEGQVVRTEKDIVSDATRTGRSIVMVEHGMVAASHYLAGQAGLDVLRRGGNAMDAAIATGAALWVVEPMMTGMGGDAFVLYYEAKTGEVHALNGSGRAPLTLNLEHFENTGQDAIKTTSWEAVTVPGAVDAYVTAHERFGSLPLSELLEPAIRYAEDGYPVSEIVGTLWFTQVGKLRQDEYSKRMWLVDEKAPETGTVFRIPELAKSLRLVAEGGRDAFYEGPIAEEIVRHAQATGGFLTMEDFKRQRSEWVDPISTDYRGYRVYQCPPNGQGIAVLIMLNILNGYDLGETPFGSPEYVHLMVEAKKLAWETLGRYVCDPSTSEIPVDMLLSEEFAATLRKRINPAKAMEEPETGLPKSNDTTTWVVVDREGNGVAFINSLYSAFGSGKTGGNTGILLQNRGEGFSLVRGHPNAYAPGKRPFHTIIPGLVTKDDKLYWVYGLMGGSMQPQGHVQLITAHIDHGKTIQEAIDYPRWRHISDYTVRLETGSPDSLGPGLESLGHRVLPGNYLLFGSAQIIQIDPATNVRWGGSDSRRDGFAQGY